MSTFKALFRNPFLLGAQGFVAGAILLWSTNDGPSVQPIPPASATSLITDAPTS